MPQLDELDSSSALVLRQRANFVSFNTITSDYTLVLSDWGKWIKANSGSAIVITVPPNASVALPVGAAIPIVRKGSGSVTVSAGAGVTINSDGEDNVIPSQYKTALLVQDAANEWLLQGIGATGSSSGGGGLTTLSTPTLTMTAASDTAIDFSWTNVANESSYTVQIATNSGFTTGVQTATPAADDTAHQFTGLTASTLYYGRVKAEGDGVTYDDSAYGTDSETTQAAGIDYDFEANFTGTAATALSAYTPETGTIGTITGSPVLDGSGKLTIPASAGFRTASFVPGNFSAHVKAELADGATFYFLAITAGAPNAYFQCLRTGGNIAIDVLVDNVPTITPPAVTVTLANFQELVLDRIGNTFSFYYKDAVGDYNLIDDFDCTSYTFTAIKMDAADAAVTVDYLTIFEP